MIIGGLYITPDREHTIDMISYHESPLTHLVLLTAQPLPDACPINTGFSLKALSCLKDPVVCVEAGSAIEEILKRTAAPCTIKNSKVNNALKDLKAGKVAAVIIEPLTYEHIKTHNHDLTATVIKLEPEHTYSEHAIGIRKNDNELGALLRRTIHELKKEGYITAQDTWWRKRYHLEIP